MAAAAAGAEAFVAEGIVRREAERAAQSNLLLSVNDGYTNNERRVIVIRDVLNFPGSASFPVELIRLISLYGAHPYVHRLGGLRSLPLPLQTERVAKNEGMNCGQTAAGETELLSLNHDQSVPPRYFVVVRSLDPSGVPPVTLSCEGMSEMFTNRGRNDVTMMRNQDVFLFAYSLRDGSFYCESGVRENGKIVARANPIPLISEAHPKGRRMLGVGEVSCFDPCLGQFVVSCRGHRGIRSFISIREEGGKLQTTDYHEGPLMVHQRDGTARMVGGWDIVLIKWLSRTKFLSVCSDGAVYESDREHRQGAMPLTVREQVASLPSLQEDESSSLKACANATFLFVAVSILKWSAADGADRRLGKQEILSSTTSLRIYSLQDFALQRIYALPVMESVSSISLSLDGTLFVSTSRHLLLWDLELEREIARVQWGETSSDIVDIVCGSTSLFVHNTWDKDCEVLEFAPLVAAALIPQGPASQTPELQLPGSVAK